MGKHGDDVTCWHDVVFIFAAIAYIFQVFLDASLLVGFWSKDVVAISKSWVEKDGFAVFFTSESALTLFGIDWCVDTLVGITTATFFFFDHEELSGITSSFSAVFLDSVLDAFSVGTSACFLFTFGAFTLFESHPFWFLSTSTFDRVIDGITDTFLFFTIAVWYIATAI